MSHQSHEGCLNRDRDLLTINRAALVHTLMTDDDDDAHRAAGRLVGQRRTVAVEIRPDVQPGRQLLQLRCVCAHALQMSVQRRVNVFLAVQSRAEELRLRLRSERLEDD